MSTETENPPKEEPIQSESLTGCDKCSLYLQFDAPLFTFEEKTHCLFCHFFCKEYATLDESSIYHDFKDAKEKGITCQCDHIGISQLFI